MLLDDFLFLFYDCLEALTLVDKVSYVHHVFLPDDSRPRFEISGSFCHIRPSIKVHFDFIFNSYLKSVIYHINFLSNFLGNMSLFKTFLVEFLKDWHLKTGNIVGNSMCPFPLFILFTLFIGLRLEKSLLLHVRRTILEVLD